MIKLPIINLIEYNRQNFINSDKNAYKDCTKARSNSLFAPNMTRNAKNDTDPYYFEADVNFIHLMTRKSNPKPAALVREMTQKFKTDNIRDTDLGPLLLSRKLVQKKFVRVNRKGKDVSQEKENGGNTANLPEIFNNADIRQASKMSRRDSIVELAELKKSKKAKKKSVFSRRSTSTSERKP